MKNSLKHLAIAAAGILILSACSKDNTQPLPGKQPHEVSFSSEKPELLDTGTRTVFENGSIFWSPSGEAIRMAYTLDGAFTNKKFYQSNSSSISDDRKTATFTVSGNFTDAAEGTVQFYALYPAAAVNSTDINYAPSITVKVSDAQAPATGSFDPEADVMLAKAVATYTGIPKETVSLRYTRMVAHGCITLSGLPFQEGETIKSIAFTAPETAKIAGSTYMDIVEQTVTDTQYATNKITLNYSDATPGAEGNFDAWFCSLPFTVAADETFTVEVKTSRGTYTRTITARTEGIEFRKNHHNKLNVNMASAAFEPNAELGLSGDYVVLAKSGDNYYALSSTPSSTRLAAKAFDYDGTGTSVSTSDETLIWTIAEPGNNNYTLANGTKYLYYPGGSENIASTSGSPCNFSITKNTDGSYKIAYAAAPTRILARNSVIANEYFAFYGGTQLNDLYLVPASLIPLPKISAEEPTLAVAYDDTSVKSIGITLTNATAEDVSVVCYEGMEGTTVSTWLSATYNGDTGTADITTGSNSGEARTGRVILTATTSLGSASATITVTQAAHGEAPVIKGLVYEENFGSPSSNTAATAYQGWEKGGITDQSGITYSYSGDTSTPIRNSSPSSGYTGASGNGCLYTAANGIFTATNINITSCKELAFSMGSQATSANLDVKYQFNTENSATTMTVTKAKTGTSWGLVEYNPITVPEGATRMTVIITIKTAHRIDDLKLNSN